MKKNFKKLKNKKMQQLPLRAVGPLLPTPAAWSEPLFSPSTRPPHLEPWHHSGAPDGLRLTVPLFPSRLKGLGTSRS